MNKKNRKPYKFSRSVEKALLMLELQMQNAELYALKQRVRELEGVISAGIKKLGKLI